MPYLAPECFSADTRQLTPGVDLYAWGIMVW